MKSVVIAGYARSPFAFAHKGELAKVRPDELLARVVAALVERAEVNPADIEDVIVGCAFPEGEQGYFIAPLIATPELRERFRSSYNLKGADGLGGLNSVSPLVMAANCENKDDAWKAMKWLAGAPEASKYFFEASGRLPVTENGGDAVPALSALPDGDVILGQPLTAEAPYPWAGEQPRWALQTALDLRDAGGQRPDDN